MAVRVILDTDVGTYYDDALTVLLATQCPEIQLEGVTTVYGDTDLRAKIAAKLLQVAGKSEVPVCKGIGKPLKGNALMFGFEGEGILTPEEKQSMKYSSQHAVDFIIEKIMENPGEITVVTMAALSNVAGAIVKEPEIVHNIRRIVVGGGIINPWKDPTGVRRSPREEYDFNNDPVATEIVFNSGIPKDRFFFTPVDVLQKSVLREEDRKKIENSSSPVAKQVMVVLEAWPPQEFLIYITMGIPTEFTRIWLMGPLVLASAFGDFMEFFPIHIAIEYPPTPIPKDMVIADDILRTVPKKREPNMMVALQMKDLDRFSKFFADRIAGGAKG